MSDGEFSQFRMATLEAYAADLIAAGEIEPSLARHQALEEFSELLPEGPKSSNHHLFVVVMDGERCGHLWLGPVGNDAGTLWVFDVEIAAEQRGRGLGKAAMLAAEEFPRDAGAKALGLRVAAVNVRARSLYESLGYTVTSVRMRKPLT